MSECPADCPEHSGLVAMIKEAVRRLAGLDQEVRDVKTAILNLHNGLANRPSWLVSAIITVLTSTILCLVGIMIGGKL